MQHVKPSSLHAERMFRTADVIDGMSPAKFDLSQWKHQSEAPSCIAGHAAWLALFGVPEKDMCARERLEALALYRKECPRLVARNWFGLENHGDAHLVLFVPGVLNLMAGLRDPEPNQSHRDDHARMNVSGRWAATTLRHFAYTGVVDWTECDPSRPNQLITTVHRPVTRRLLPLVVTRELEEAR